MNIIKPITALALIAAFLAAPLAGRAEEKKDAKAKPYTLDKCIVSDEKLDGHGKPYVFTHEGQEYKLCCKPCLKDFNKNPAKYLKKLKDAEAEKAKAKK